jgi:hypothetical protein
MLRPRILSARLDIRRIRSAFYSSGILSLFLDIDLTILLRRSLHLVFGLVEE